MFSTGLFIDGLCGADVVEGVRVVELVLGVIRVACVAVLGWDVRPKHREVRLNRGVVALGEDGLAEFDLG